MSEATSSYLDLINTQNPCIIDSTDALPSFCSDHSVPFAILKQDKHEGHRFKRKIYNYGKLDQKPELGKHF